MYHDKFLAKEASSYWKLLPRQHFKSFSDVVIVVLLIVFSQLNIPQKSTKLAIKTG